MGTRITTGGRERLDFPFHHAETTAEAAAAEGRLGPFTMQQVVALFWRVKAVRIVASVTYERFTPDTEDDPSTTESATFDSDQVAVRAIYSHYPVEPLTDIQIYVEAASDYGFFACLSPNSKFISTGGLQGIQKDESGGYWLRILIHVGSGAPDYAIIGNDDYGGYGFDCTAVLTVFGAEYDIPVTAYGGLGATAATCAITVDEWLPYATTGAAAVWDADTGASVASPGE
jgi:hypothetical protein